MRAVNEDRIARAAAARRAGRSEDALKEYRAAIAEARGSLALALAGAGQAERDLGDAGAALACYAEAAAVQRAIGDTDRVAHNLRHMADIHADAGRYDAALPLYEEALALYRAQPATHPLDLANALRGMAIAAEALRGRDAARALWREARDLYRGEGVEAGVRECERRLAAG